MRSLVDSLVDGTRSVFESPKLAAGLYMAALVAVLATVGRRED